MNEIPTICAWSDSHDKPLQQREEELAQSMGITREELLKTLSHGLCLPCKTIMTNESEETKEVAYDPDGGPRRWRLEDYK